MTLGQLSPRALRIRERLFTRLVKRGGWDVGKTPLLNVLAHLCDEHLRLREEVRASDLAQAVTLAEKAVEARELARLTLAELGLIDRSRIRAAILNEQGDDALIAELAD